MKGYAEILCFSESLRDLLRKDGSDAGVILIDGAEMPLLTTETVTNQRLPESSNRQIPERKPKQNPEELKSHWKDAVVVLRSDGTGYQRLIDGTNSVTKAGKAWCAAHDVEPTPEALRYAAERQDCVRMPMRVNSPIRYKK